MTHNIKNTLLLLVSVAMFAITGCTEDDAYTYTSHVDLEASIVDANTLLETTEEGTLVGMQQPGSKAQLENTLTWVEYTKLNAESEAEIDDAAVKLDAQIDIYENAVVAKAIPYIQQGDEGTMIELSSKAHDVIAEAFTIEGTFYAVSLNNVDHASSLFSTVQSGPDSGFLIRYFPSGLIEINVGGGSWTDIKAPEGTVVAGEWFHVTYVNEISHHTLYINGEVVAEGDADYIATTDEYPVVIGNTPAWTSRMMDGMVQEFRLWKGARTAEEIQATMDQVLVGTEDNLEVYFPLTSDLGSEFVDMTESCTATLKGSVEWVADGIPPVVALTYEAFDSEVATIAALNKSVKDGGLEGTADGDFPVGTSVYLESLLTEAADVRKEATSQTTLDEEVTSLEKKRGMVEEFLVADTDGLYFDAEDDDAVGFRITPNYTPQGDYTVEFDVNIESLVGSGTGELFNNGMYGLWYTKYEEDASEEDMFASGALWNFTDAGNGWEGPKADALSIVPMKWLHVAVVHDENAQTTALYIDGVLKGIDTELGAPGVSGWGETWLGNGWGGKIWGSIRNYRLWDAVRTSSELGTDITGEELGLKAYFPLDRVNGVRFDDVTGNFEGELRGISWTDATIVE